jgi:hypothetical protein
MISFTDEKVCYETKPTQKQEEQDCFEESKDS